jgi:hypothetical protein
VTEHEAQNLKRHSLLEFWIQRSVEYPELADKVIYFLMPFARMHLREVGFSSLVALKSKYKIRMSPVSDKDSG